MAHDTGSRALIGDDGKLRPIVRAVIYAALAFWVLSADGFLGPSIERLGNALHATGLSPAGVSYYELISLLTALLLTWLFGLYEGRRIDDYGLPACLRITVGTECDVAAVLQILPAVTGNGMVSAHHKSGGLRRSAAGS